MTPRYLLAGLSLACLLTLGVGCDYVQVGTGPFRGVAPSFGSGVYHVEAWSDFAGRHPIWWGRLDLRITRGGSISGIYRFPGQCSGGFGRAVDCVGRVSGRIDGFGRIFLELDDGWFAADGNIHSAARATGVWDVRLRGFRDGGTFDLFLV